MTTYSQQDFFLHEINEEISRYQQEISSLKKKILELETECIGLLLQKENYEERLRLYRLKKGLLSDGSPE